MIVFDMSFGIELMKKAEEILLLLITVKNHGF